MIDRDAVSSDASPPEVGPSCSTLPNDAPLVTASRVAQAPPSPLGGPLRDGTYFLVATTVYTGLGGRSEPDGPASRTTVSLVAGHYETVAFDPTRGEFRHAGAVSTAGVSYRLATECPERLTSTLRYTATAEALTLFFATEDGTSVSTYARRE